MRKRIANLILRVSMVVGMALLCGVFACAIVMIFVISSQVQTVWPVVITLAMFSFIAAIIWAIYNSD